MYRTLEIYQCLFNSLFIFFYSIQQYNGGNMYNESEIELYCEFNLIIRILDRAVKEKSVAHKS